jgi:hypothetical protein
MTPGQIEDALADYAAIVAGRDELILAALAAGLTKHRIHLLSGIARTTIDKIIAGNGRARRPVVGRRM